MASAHYIVPDMDGVEGRDMVDNRFKQRTRQSFSVLAQGMNDVI